MSRTIYFITHSDVEISADVPVTQWPLSATGRARFRVMLNQPWVNIISAIYCSTEQKAIDSVKILADHLGIRYTQVAELGENDRSSTGFLKPVEFEATADRFFASPTTSIRGWETAAAAQSRIVDAISYINNTDQSQDSIAIISHGAVGTLLYCFYTGKIIDRRWDQPGQGGGNYLSLELETKAACSWWKSID